MIQIQSVLIFRKGTATQLNWSIQSYERNSTQVQVAYSLTLNGQMVEEGIKTMNNVIDNGTISLEDITNALVTVLTTEP